MGILILLVFLFLFIVSYFFISAGKNKSIAFRWAVIFSSLFFCFFAVFFKSIEYRAKRAVDSHCENNQQAHFFQSKELANKKFIYSSVDDEDRFFWEHVYSLSKINANGKVFYRVSNSVLMDNSDAQLYRYDVYPLESPRCENFSSYLDTLPKKLRVNIRKNSPEFNYFCIAGSPVNDLFDDFVKLTIDKEYHTLSKAIDYRLEELRFVLRDEESRHVLADLRRPLVYPSVKLFEFDTKRVTDSSCGNFSISPQFELINQFIMKLVS